MRVSDGGVDVGIVDGSKLDKLRGEVLQGFPGQAKARIDFAHGRACVREGGRNGRGDILGDVLHGFERVARRTGLGDNGVHAFIHFGEGGEGGCAHGGNWNRDIFGQALADAADLIADCGNLAASFFQRSGDGSIRFLGLGFEVFQFFLGGDDLAFPGVVLLLCNRTIFQALIHLVLHSLQFGEFSFRLLNRLRKQVLLLGEQFRIGGIEL